MERNVNIDFVRSVSCLAVVFMHTVAVFWYKTPIKLMSLVEYKKQEQEFIDQDIVLSFFSPEWYTCSFLDSLTRFCVPCFVMISGAIILNRDFVSIKYSFKKLRHIIKIILLWGSVCALLYATTSMLFNEGFHISSFIQSLLTGGGLFWYLYMLLPLYFAAPIFRMIISDKDSIISFLILWMLFSVILPFMQVLMPSLSGRIYFEYLEQFSVYAGYFLIGGLLYNKVFLSRLYTIICSYKINWPLAKKCLLFIIGGGYFMSLVYLKPAGLFHNFTTPFVICYSIMAFYYLGKIQVAKRVKNIILFFARYSMGVYALHISFLTIFMKIWQPNASLWLCQIFVYFVATITLSFACSFCLKKIGIFKNV